MTCLFRRCNKCGYTWNVDYEGGSCPNCHGKREDGGHFCPEWDYMFIFPGSKEAECCICNFEMTAAHP